MELYLPFPEHLRCTDRKIYTFSKGLIKIADYDVIMRCGHKIEYVLSQNVLSCWKFERCYRLLHYYYYYCYCFILFWGIFLTSVSIHLFRLLYFMGLKSHSSVQILDFLMILQIIRHQKLCKVMVASDCTVIVIIRLQAHRLKDRKGS